MLRKWIMGLTQPQKLVQEVRITPSLRWCGRLNTTTTPVMTWKVIFEFFRKIIVLALPMMAPSHFWLVCEIGFEFWVKSGELWKNWIWKAKVSKKKVVFGVFWSFESRNRISSIPSILECENWSKRVVGFGFRVFLWIWGSKLEIVEI